MDFEYGCSEVDYILEHLNPEDKKKIPDYVIGFFKNNKSLFYKVNLDAKKKLDEQELRDETKAFLQLIYYKYLANEEEKYKFNQFLKNISSSIETEELKVLDNGIKNEENSKLIIYKENKLLKFINRIFNFIKRK